MWADVKMTHTAAVHGLVRVLLLLAGAVRAQAATQHRVLEDSPQLPAAAARAPVCRSRVFSDEQLCFMVGSFVGMGAQGHLTGYKLTSSATSSKMLKDWTTYRKAYNRLLNAPAISVHPPACAFPAGGSCRGYNMSATCWQHCDLENLGYDGVFRYLPVGYFIEDKVKAMLILYNQGHETITIPRLALNVALMGDLQSLSAMDGATITTLPVVQISRFIANITGVGLKIPTRSVKTMFFYLPSAEAPATEHRDSIMSCAKPSELMAAAGAALKSTDETAGSRKHTDVSVVPGAAVTPPVAAHRAAAPSPARNQSDTVGCLVKESDEHSVWIVHTDGTRNWIPSMPANLAMTRLSFC